MLAISCPMLLTSRPYIIQTSCPLPRQLMKLRRYYPDSLLDFPTLSFCVNKFNTHTAPLKIWSNKWAVQAQEQTSYPFHSCLTYLAPPPVPQDGPPSPQAAVGTGHGLDRRLSRLLCIRIARRGGRSRPSGSGSCWGGRRCGGRRRRAGMVGGW